MITDWIVRVYRPASSTSFWVVDLHPEEKRARRIAAHAARQLRQAGYTGLTVQTVQADRAVNIYLNCPLPTE